MKECLWKERIDMLLFEEFSNYLIPGGVSIHASSEIIFY